MRSGTQRVPADVVRPADGPTFTGTRGRINTEVAPCTGSTAIIHENMVRQIRRGYSVLSGAHIDAHLVIAGHCTIDDIQWADGSILPATPGGAAAYAAVGAAMYGARVTLVSRVGGDYPLGRFRDSLLPHAGLDVSHVRLLGPRSIHNLITYRTDGARRCEVERWDLMEEHTPTADDLPPEVIRDGSVLLTPGSLDKQLAATRHARAHGRPVAVDSELHYFPDAERRRLLAAVVAEASCFLPSIEHLQTLYGTRSVAIEDYLDRLPALGCPWIVVKQGARGSTLVDCRACRAWHIPALHGLIVRDVTGAGDGFSGGFMAALSDGREPVDAACWGTVAASFVVESVGALMPPHFSRDRMNARYVHVREGVTEMETIDSVGGRPVRDG